MKTVTSINGRLVPKARARVSVFDNSFLYAEGLFETFLSIDHKPVFLGEHLDRLLQGAETTGLTVPANRTRLAAWLRKTTRAHPARVQRLRLTLTSGESPFWVGKPGRPQVIISAAPHRMPAEPFRLWVSPWRVDHLSPLRQVKTLSYAISATSIKRAHELGFHDALLLNQRGNVAEVTSANIYWLERDRLYTPPLGAGCLAGVTRRVMFREAESLGLKLTERRCSFEKLVAAEEVLISSSLKLICPVGLIRNGRRVYRLPSGELAPMLAEHFRNLAGLS